MLPNHPTKDIIGTSSNRLLGKKIVLAMCGSVGIVKAPDLARLLIREGAEVIPVMSSAACDLISPTLMEWATGNQVITQLTGSVEHVELCGNTTTKADLLLIYPSTANTLSKIACGIDDTVVTTFATTALGEGIPTIIVPSMHLPMFHHPAVEENIAKLRRFGVTVLEPRLSEGKAKILSPEELCQTVISKIPLQSESSPQKPSNKKILITSGRTIESIDPFRVITNRSSGKMGAALANAALKRGWEVTLISGAAEVQYPSVSKLIKIESTREMLNAIHSEIRATHFDAIVCAAAVSDWTPATTEPQKISTDKKELNLKLVPTPKIVDTIKEISPKSLLVAFRALSGMTNDEMLSNGKKRLQKANADLICINAIDQPDSGFEKETNAFIVFSKKGKTTTIPTQSKVLCGERIIELIDEELQ